MTLADRTLNPSPVATALKPSVYDCAAFRTLCIGIPVAVLIFRYELSFRHEGMESVAFVGRSRLQVSPIQSDNGARSTASTRRPSKSRSYSPFSESHPRRGPNET